MINRKKLFLKYFLNNLFTFIVLSLTLIFYDKINLGYEDVSKLCFCLILPLLNLLQSLFLVILSLLESKNNHIKNSKTFNLINKYLSLYLNFGQCLILLSIVSVNISLLTIFIEMLGLVMLTLGNYFPKLKESNIIKSVSFNVNKDVNKWNRFTRVSGFTYLFIGLVIMLLGVFDEFFIIFIALGLIIFSGVCLQLYSIALGKR